MYKEYIVRQSDCPEDDFYFYDGNEEDAAVAMSYGKGSVDSRLILRDASITWHVNEEAFQFNLHDLDILKNMIKILVANNDNLFDDKPSFYELVTENWMRE